MAMEHQATTDVSNADEHGARTLRRKKRRKWLLVLVLALAVGGGYYWYRAGEIVAQDEPLIVAISIGDIENTIASAGTLQPSEIVDVGAQVSGQLQKLYVDIGDLVEDGQLLAEIDARVQQNRVEASRASIAGLEAQIASRQAALELARANAKRQERLMAERATSQLDYDSALNNLASAESSLIQLEKQIEQSVASLASDETQLEYTRIFAPIDGTVVSIAMNEGVTLNANQTAPTILQVADLSVMTVETQISEADIGRIKAGMDVYFTTLGGGERRWYSKLSQILPTPTVENNVVLYTGLFDVDNADGALLSGMTTQVYFVTSSARDVLTVPVGALTYTDTQPSAGDMAARIAARRSSEGGPPNGFRGGAFPRGEGPPPDFPPNGFPPGGFSPGGNGSPRDGFGEAGGAAGGFAARFAGGVAATDQPRSATVRVVNDDGSIVEREIIVGVTSRIAAEVISGLSPGERVVAGIVQADAPVQENNNNDRGFRGIPGGFRMF